MAAIAASARFRQPSVPTALVYNANNTVSSWGFLCADDDDDTAPPRKTRCEFFKLSLDAETLAGAHAQGITGAPASTLEAQRLTTDYLAQVYRHFKGSIERELGRQHTGGWTDMSVQFLFSVPTTWTSLRVVRGFNTVIRDAGFGVEGSRHKAEVDLTEAEAAAVAAAVATLKTSTVRFDLGSLFLSVDAGGGTTDIALMQVTSADQQVP